MRALRITAVALLASLVAGGVASSQDGAGAGYRVIVNPANSAASVDRKFLRDAFLKKTLRWPGGEPIRPADLAPRSRVRAKFSEELLGRSIAAVRSFWQQSIFSGRDVPPPEFDDEALIVRYVLKHPGGVGYVGGGTDLQGAKVLAVD